MVDKKLKMGMIGGGPGAFIGDIHRKAAALDGLIELVSGCFSSDPSKSKAMGQTLFLNPARVYNNYKEMIDKESRLPDNERIDIVSIVTPNYLHFEPAVLALEHGFHVICDKPMTINIKEAEILVLKAEENKKLFCLTHTYTGYPLVKEARIRVKNNELGKIRKIVVEYPQGWLSEPLEKQNNKQASWRLDPEKAGSGGSLGDIGTHAANLAEYISGLRITEVFADLTSFIEGRKLDDDCNLLVHFENGVKGVLYSSQISVGEENGLKIRIYGDKASLVWEQMEPNTLIMKYHDRPAQILRGGSGSHGLSTEALNHFRLPPGHPEGFIEAFANLYRDFALTIVSDNKGLKPSEWVDFPSVYDGLRGMKFIEAVIKSSEKKQWATVS